MDEMHGGDFLWLEERELLHHVIAEQDEAFAWDDTEKGTFKEEFFPLVKMAVKEHTPWVLRNIPIPPGMYDEVCKMIHVKIDAGMYELSNSSYRSRWFCVRQEESKDHA